MLGKTSKAEDLRRRLDRRRGEFDEAKRVHNIVTAANWPDVKWWIETQMAKCGEMVGNMTDPLQIAALMGSWNGLRVLLASAEKCKDLSELEVHLKNLHDEFQKKAMGG